MRLQAPFLILFSVLAIALPRWTAPTYSLSAQQSPTSRSSANDQWTVAAGELADKIVTRTAPQAALVLAVRNLSSLGDEDVARFRQALRSELRSREMRLMTNKDVGVNVLVTLSENEESLVWVAEIQNGPTPDIAMVTVDKLPRETLHPATEPLVIRKTRIYQQADPILDAAPVTLLPGDTSYGLDVPAQVAAYLLVLGIGKVTVYQNPAPVDKAPLPSNGKAWQMVASLPISRILPWPRDTRGRVVPRTGNQFDVYLPGARCSGTLEPPSLQCQEGDEPWPLSATGSDASTSAAGLAAHFAPDRSFFDGRIRLDDGNEIKAPPFFAAAVMSASRAAWGSSTAGAGTSAVEGSTYLLLSGLDDRGHLINGEGASVANFDGLGGNIVRLRTACYSGAQILASGTGDFSEPDAIHAYDFVNLKLVEASSPVEFAGPITELWPEANGSAAIAISHNLKTSDYEAFRLSISCGD